MAILPPHAMLGLSPGLRGPLDEDRNPSQGLNEILTSSSEAQV